MGAPPGPTWPSGDPLEIASFPVDEVVAGDATTLEGWRLSVDLASIEASAAAAPGLLGLHAEIVRPADPVRLINVLDAVEPAIKPEHPDTTFPGALGSLAAAGEGRTNRLDGLAVIPVADFRRGHDLSTLDVKPDGDAVIDMQGPGAASTPWSRTTNLVLEFACDPTVPLAEVDRSVRRTTLQVARELAATTLGLTADRVETFALPAAQSGLPRVCVILQIAAEGPLTDTYLYGDSLKGMVPTYLDPREVLDGALTAGQYDWAGVRNPTCFYQRSELLLELLRAHGERLCFSGVVLSIAYLASAFDKLRQATLAAKLARQTGAQGAIITTFSSGNSHTDTMLTCRACEQLGVRSTVLIAETNGGLTDHVPEADAVVSVGNEEELVAEWRPKRVIGGERLLNGRRAEDAGPLAVVAYLGAVSQMGDMRLRGVSA